MSGDLADDPPGLGPVRAILGAPRDVELPPDLAGPAPAPDGDPGPAPDDHRGGGDDPPPGDAPGDGLPWDRIERCADEPLNDLGNSRRLIIHFGEDLIWVPRVGWFTWTGALWRKDPDMIEVRARSHRISALMEAETRFITVPPARQALVARREEVAGRIAALRLVKKRTPEQDGELAELVAVAGEIAGVLALVQDRIGQRLSFAKTTGNSERMKNMVAEAGIRLARPLEALDAQALWVNTLSGVLAFGVAPGPNGGPVAEVTLLPHERGQMMSKIMPVAYDPDAQAPAFHRFLDRIMPDPVMQRFLQRWFGLSMTAITGEQKLCFFYGTGANGKSVLVDLIARILGDYAATAKIESLTGSNRRGGGDATPDLVPLIGARFVRTSEPEEGVKWQEGLIKELTGGEPILVRALHSDFVAVRPQFKLGISGNHRPDIRGLDDGIWRRLLLVPFDEKIPEAEKVKKHVLDEALFAEAPGVLNWLVEGLLAYLEIGLDEPEKVLAATAEFRAESDPYGQFLDDACLVTGRADDSIAAAELVQAFHFWLGRRGEGQFKDRTVALAMAKHSRTWASPATKQKFTARKASGLSVYDGIRFTDLFKRDWSSAPRDQNGRVLGFGKPSSGGDEESP